jgi:hypothetical protein
MAQWYIIFGEYPSRTREDFFSIRRRFLEKQQHVSFPNGDEVGVERNDKHHIPFFEYVDIIHSGI